ncbi:MAG: hypothetical protein ACRCX4_12320 [Bacteroidales bacterium]
MKITFKILLVACIAVLGYLCTKSILDPIKFQEEKDKREKAVIARLIDIRKAQMEYRNINGKYTGSFDTLITFIKEGKLPMVLKEGVLTDEQLEKGMTEKEAVKLGLIKRDTTYIAIIDTLYKPGFIADSIAFVPGTANKFEMKSGEISTASGLMLQVFEAKTPYSVYLNGLDKQEIYNLIDVAKKLDKYPGLKVGSVEEANNNAGNWE